MNPFSHVIGEEEAFVDFLESLIPSSVDTGWYDYCDRIEGTRRNNRGEAEFWGDEGGRGFRRRGDGRCRRGGRSPSGGGGGSGRDGERSGGLILIFRGGSSRARLAVNVCYPFIVDRDVVGRDGEGSQDGEGDGGGD